MTKQQIIEKIVDKTGCTKKAAGEAYEAIVQELVHELRTVKAAAIPDLAKLTVAAVKERAAGKYTFAGKEYDLPFRPASKKVKAKAFAALSARIA